MTTTTPLQSNPYNTLPAKSSTMIRAVNRLDTVCFGNAADKKTTNALPRKNHPPTGLKRVWLSLVNALRTSVFRPRIESNIDHELGHLLLCELTSITAEKISVQKERDSSGIALGGTVYSHSKKYNTVPKNPNSEDMIDHSIHHLKEFFINRAGKFFEKQYFPNLLLWSTSRGDDKNMSQSMYKLKKLLPDKYNSFFKRRKRRRKVDQSLKLIFSQIPEEALIGIRKELKEKKKIEGEAECKAFLHRHLDPAGFDWKQVKTDLNTAFENLIPKQPTA